MDEINMSDMFSASRALFEMFVNLTEAGFSERQAILIIVEMIRGGTA